MQTQHTIIAALVILTALLMGADPVETKKPVEPVQIAGVDWKARALAWFKSTDEKARRKEMRPAGRAIRRACRYCHTADFKGYKANRLISQQMMALSADFKVPCKGCHSGRGTFTPLGKASLPMWDVSRETSKFCNDCHPTTDPTFEALTPAGEVFQKTYTPAKPLNAVAKPGDHPKKPK